MKNEKILAGDTFKTNEGGEVRVIRFGGCYDITIEHIDKIRHSCRVTTSQLKGGRIKNPYKPRIYGVGFVGHGNHKPSENGKDTHAYTAWSRMLERAYCPKKLKENRSYAGCSVAEEWHDFQCFGDWYDSQEFKGYGYQLDKDILIPGNKEYGPLNCRFVPEPINKMLLSNKYRRSSLPIGVTQVGNKYTTKTSKSGKVEWIGTFCTINEAFAAYKESRERYIKDQAEEFRAVMPEEVYEALIKIKVSISD